MKIHLFLIALLGLGPALSAADFPLYTAGKATPVLTDPKDAAVVAKAAELLKGDIAAVSGNPTSQENAGLAVIAGTLEGSALIKEAIASSKLDFSTLKGKWECYARLVVSNPLPRSHPGLKQALLIVGSDRRGTAYGLLSLSEEIGISPWIDWADVPPAHRDAVTVADTRMISKPPSVKYRGIFLNDEDWGLRVWAAKTIEPQLGNIGPKTYARIFPLMLRLKANFLWPAMHEKTLPFNATPENARLADEYGIVMGASHCEPLLRNNVEEWDKAKFGEWDYVTNRDRILSYWKERVESNGLYENLYTVGMRGIHDGAMPGGGTRQDKTDRLARVIKDQRDLFTSELKRPVEQVPQLFCPYKEVLDLYRNKLSLPDDITLLWADDNHGYIRQLSNAAEQKRSGGAGVYYHLSYWGAPEDFLWLSSISPELISSELTRAYQHGAGRVWMINVGDIKPAEKELTFAMQLAWDINRWTPEKAKNFSAEWAAQTFSRDLAAPISQLLQRYYDLCARSKPEHIEKIAFTRSETEARLKECRALLNDVDALAAKIPAAQRDAWYQLIEYPIKGAALINIKHLQPRLTPEDLAPSDKAQKEIAKLTDKYNALGNGKWKGMMSYQPRKRPVFQPVTKAPDSALLLSDFVAQLSPTDFKPKSDNSLTASLKNLKPGNYHVRLRFLPNHPVTDDAHLRVTARANATAPVTQDLEQAEYSKGWSVNVLRGFAEINVPTEVKADGKLDLQLDFLDPDIHLLGAEVFAE